MIPTCRHCSTPLNVTFVDLGLSPISNALIDKGDVNTAEASYPLHARVCAECFLVQVDDVVPPSVHFNESYVYFSSFSKSWLEHAAKYCDQITKEKNLNASSFVIEIASNDGYLLQNFVNKKIPCLGVEPSKNVAEVALKKGIDTVVEFFGTKLAERLVREGKSADLVLGNNVVAHVPDINDFVAGLECLIKPDGLINLEFPHLLQLIKNHQFDTIYHEHFSYLSLSTLIRIFEKCNLNIYDCEELSTHGGSLRIYATKNLTRMPTDRLKKVLADEESAGLSHVSGYQGFAREAKRVKSEFVLFIAQAKAEGKKIAAYGAAAKGNTLLNYCEVKADAISWVVDLNPVKQGKLLPGSRIPVVDFAQIQRDRPDYLIILPWNLKSEISEQAKVIREWGGRFVVAIPKLEVF